MRKQDSSLSGSFRQKARLCAWGVSRIHRLAHAAWTQITMPKWAERLSKSCCAHRRCPARSAKMAGRESSAPRPPPPTRRGATGRPGTWRTLLLLVVALAQGKTRPLSLPSFIHVSSACPRSITFPCLAPVLPCDLCFSPTLERPP
jgi:hypothetical protein